MDEFGLGPIFASMDKIINFGAVTVDSAPASKERELLETVVAQLRRVRAEMPEAIPQELGKLKARAEGVRDEAKRLSTELDAAKARLDGVRQQVDAAKAQAQERLAAPPPMPPDLPLPPIDFELGARLRTEILNRYQPGAASATPPEAGKDIWEDWK